VDSGTTYDVRARWREAHTDVIVSTEYHHSMTKVPFQTLPSPLPDEPMAVAAAWLAEAWALRAQPNPNAMTLATVGADGRPSARIVLCKDIVLPDGFVRFVSNYESKKGVELAHEPRAAIVLHWDHLHRQVRIEGHVTRSPEAESEEYFQTRPWQSRVGAWASSQSRPVDSREQLIEQLRAAGRRFETPPVGPDAPYDERRDLIVHVPRPANWGGYRLWADAIELWVEGEYRIHDRARFERTLTPDLNGGFKGTAWQATRLQP
jgi:pyridoxamine 5'-phosphate oxidase